MEEHPVILQLLARRGVTDPEAIERFLHPSYERDVHLPSLFSRMEEAVARVFLALERGEKIRIHGDYDADGICGASVLYATLRDIISKLPERSSANISVFLPDRERDGYGFSLATAERFAEEGVELVITVDCGISSKPAIERGRELGMETIVCDHHAMPAELPEGAILLHPLVPGETYPNKHLCGTGVAGKLAWALLDEARHRGADVPPGSEKWLLDLIAIATVTDVMPLVGENRALESYGLKVLGKTRRAGLKKLMDVAGVKLPAVDTYNIGFQIGPRINAAGRMTEARHSFELLVEEDDLVAAVKAGELDLVNRQRQRASDALYAEALRSVSSDDKLIVAHGEGWHLGLVGLVAGKLLSEFGRPVFVVARHGDRFTGSGRSVRGFDITQALHSASSFLHKFGGHPQACGFTAIGEDNFRSAMEIARRLVEEKLPAEALTVRRETDMELSLEDLDASLAEMIESLAPFGEGNPRPVFLSRGVSPVRFSLVGKDGQHVKMTLCQKGGRKMWDAIGFGLSLQFQSLALRDTIDVTYELGWNEWQGRKSVQLRLVEINLCT